VSASLRREWIEQVRLFMKLRIIRQAETQESRS
jgi:hypothetical protein